MICVTVANSKNVFINLSYEENGLLEVIYGKKKYARRRIDEI